MQAVCSGFEQEHTHTHLSYTQRMPGVPCAVLHPRPPTHLHVAFMQCACDDEHHIVNHVAVCAKVQEPGQGLVRLCGREGGPGTQGKDVGQQGAVHTRRWAKQPMKPCTAPCSVAVVSLSLLLVHIPTTAASIRQLLLFCGQCTCAVCANPAPPISISSRAAHLAAHGIPVVHQFLCAPVHDGGGVQGRRLIGKVAPIVCGCLQGHKQQSLNGSSSRSSVESGHASTIRL